MVDGVEDGNVSGDQLIPVAVNNNIVNVSGNTITSKGNYTFKIAYSGLSSDGTSQIYYVKNGGSTLLYQSTSWYAFNHGTTQVSMSTGNSLYFRIQNGGKHGVGIAVYI